MPGLKSPQKAQGPREDLGRDGTAGPTEAEASLGDGERTGHVPSVAELTWTPALASQGESIPCASTNPGGAWPLSVAPQSKGGR